jgi:hypothetical protein
MQDDNWANFVSRHFLLDILAFFSTDCHCMLHNWGRYHYRFRLPPVPFSFFIDNAKMHLIAWNHADARRRRIASQIT